MPQVMEVKQLSRIIGVIGRQKVRLDNMVQTAAAQCIAQSIVNRNSTPAAQLFEAIGVSSRRDALVAYFEMFGNLAWSKGEKRMVFADMHKLDPAKYPKLKWSEEYAAKVCEYIWHKAKAAPEIKSSFDVEEKVAQLIDSLRKASKKGTKLENVELLDGVESLYVRFVGAKQDAKDMAAAKPVEGVALDAARDAAKDTAANSAPAMSDREALAVQMKGGVQLVAA